MISRRALLQASALGGVALSLPWRLRFPPPGGGLPGDVVDPVLDPMAIPKYGSSLVIPPVMPPRPGSGRAGIDEYMISVRQFRQQILPSTLPATTVWGYGSTFDRDTFNYPSFSLEAEVDRPVRVTWLNELVDARGRYLPHLLPVDPTLHWANPGGGIDGRDMRPMFSSTPGAYRGPVPIVTHLHGSHATDESDGYAEAWYLPRATDIPAGYATVGSWYDRFRSKARDRFGAAWPTGGATYQYANDQRASTLWFHDHTLGMTRLNVYAGPAGFYLLRGGRADLPDGVLPGPAPRLGDAPGTRYHEIPLAIQDRTFTVGGSLWFPPSRDAFGDVEPGGPYIPDTDVSPIWNPEFFGRAMVVNGRTWPTLTVEARRYRFRILNGCNSRFLMLKIAADPLGRRPLRAAIPFWQIGSEGGFLPEPVESARLLMGNAERADVIVDFTGIRPGTELFLVNEGPDEPFSGGDPDRDFDAADPQTTGQVMRFVVTAAQSVDRSVPPDELSLPAIAPIGEARATRRLSLNEVESAAFEGAPSEALLGTIEADGSSKARHWMDDITERVRVGATETWEFHNLTADAHPMHVHEVMFQVVDRRPIGHGRTRGPEAWEHGFKDTVITYPGEITRIRATFDLAGRYVWHCHIVDHEDNEMMRPYDVG